jgi:hypothetical protein
MKKHWPKIVCILLASVCLLGVLVCCSIRMYVNHDHYTMVDYNLVWIDGDYKINTTFYGSIFGLCRYYKIQDIPLDEYVACEYRPNELGPRTIPLVMKHNDFEGTLSYDTTSAKIFLGQDNLDGRSEGWIDYGINIVQKEVALVEKEITEQIVSDISAKENYLNYQYFLDIDEEPHSLYYGENRDVYRDRLRIKIPIKEYDNLMWVATIEKAGDHYYLEILVDHRWGRKFLPCSDEFEELIDAIILEYGLSIS